MAVTIMDAKAALSQFVTDAGLDADVRATLSKLTASFVAAVVREERRKAAEDKDRALRALRAAVEARDAANPFASLFR